MLVLTRDKGQKIRINDDIEIILLGIGGKQARIGINAPKHVSVHREEIYQRINGVDSDQPEAYSAS